MEIEPTIVGSQARADAVVAHRQQPRRDAEAAAEIVGDLRKALTRREPPSALDMSSEIAVAELEPGFAAQRLQRRHEGPGLATPAPSELRVVDPAESVEEGVEEGVDIGRNREAEMLEIVAGVGDHGQLPRRQNAV